jgi:NAD(P)-dependent dehydrogenase (short-subunit alcohol dehydrogenase family)
MVEQQVGGGRSRELGGQDFSGKTVIVLGAGGGLGSGIAKRFGARGARLVLSDYEASTLGSVEVSLRESGAEVISIQADISKQPDVEAIKTAALLRFGDVDIVCNTVGVAARDAWVWDISDNDWRWNLAVNFWGVLNVIRSFVPLLVARGSGHILNTASTRVVTTPRAGAGAYIASKHAVVGVSEVLQQDLRAVASNVRVSVILPGTIKSRFESGQRNRQPEYGQSALRPAEEQALYRAHLDSGTLGEVLAERAIAELGAGKFYIFGRDEDIVRAEERSAGIVGGMLAAAPANPLNRPGISGGHLV